MTKTGLEFVILVIVICLLFDICDLEFLMSPLDCRKGGRVWEPPLGVVQSRTIWAQLLYSGIASRLSS